MKRQERTEWQTLIETQRRKLRDAMTRREGAQAEARALGRYTAQAVEAGIAPRTVVRWGGVSGIAFQAVT